MLLKSTLHHYTLRFGLTRQQKLTMIYRPPPNKLFTGLQAVTLSQCHKRKRVNSSTSQYTRATITECSTPRQARGVKHSSTQIYQTTLTLPAQCQTKTLATILGADPGTKHRFKTRTMLLCMILTRVSTANSLTSRFQPILISRRWTQLLLLI